MAVSQDCAERAMLFSPESIVVGEVAPNARGIKTAIVALRTGAPATFLPTSPVRVTFEPSAFNDPTATRLNLVMQASAEVCAYLEQVDAWAIEHITKNSLSFFKKVLTSAEVAQMHKPCIQASEKYDASFKTNINIAGVRPLRCWTPDKLAREAPLEWRSCEVVPLVWVRTFWVQSNPAHPKQPLFKLE